MSIKKKIFMSIFGVLVSSATAAAPEVKIVQVEPPPLDGKRAPSNSLVPWLARDGLYGYADRDGTIKIAPRFTDARRFYEGFAAVSVNHVWGFIQPSGDFQIAPAYVVVSDFLDGLAQANTYKPGIYDPIFGKPLVYGTTKQHTIDRRGNVQKVRVDSDNGASSVALSDNRFFHRYLSGVEFPRDWVTVRLPEGGWAARRVDGSLEYRFADLTTIVLDARSGAATFIATREKGTQTWKVLNLHGKVIASGLGPVSPYSSEGAFSANTAPYNHAAAYNADGHRFTPALGQTPFVFYDGVAEVQLPLVSRKVYVDRSGRIYIDPEYLKDLYVQWDKAYAVK